MARGIYRLDQTVQYLGLLKTSIGLKTSQHVGLKGIDMSEPVEYQYRTRPDWILEWNGWNTCSKDSAEAYEKTPYLHDWHYEVRRLYTTPPQRTWVGLTDEERNHARQTVTYSQLAMTASEWADAVQIETERRLQEKNNA